MGISMEFNDFKPYLVYRNNIEDLNRFESLTEIAYGLSEQLLFKYPKDNLSPINFKEITSKDSDLSFTESDIKIIGVDEVCRWVTAEEYSELTNSDIELIKRDLEQGKLGHIKNVEDTGEKWIIWPAEYQDRQLDELPELGKKKFKMKAQIEAKTELGLDTSDVDSFEEVQHSFLYLAHSLGDKEEVNKRAREMLNKSCFIQHWTAFESFLKESIRELFKLYPEKILLGKSNKNATIKYDELFELSNQFQSMDSLLNSLVEKEIEKQQSEGKSVHGLINFLKTEFRFEKNPYDSSYVYKSKRNKTDYNDLIEIKDVRNALVHDSGCPNVNFFEKYPNVPRKENHIVIDEDYYLKSRLILDSIAYSIVKSISELASTKSNEKLVTSDVAN